MFQFCFIPCYLVIASFITPDLTRIFEESRDYDELARVWIGWRDVPKGKMKELYTEFVQLSNEGVRGTVTLVFIVRPYQSAMALCTLQRCRTCQHLHKDFFRNRSYRRHSSVSLDDV